MQVEIKIEASCTEPKVIIMTSSVTSEVNNVLKKLSEDTSQIISGSKNGKISVLEQADLIRIYANDKKVFAVTGDMSCANGCMNWKNVWTDAGLCGSPIQKSSI